MKRIKGFVIGFITFILVLIVIFNIYNFVSINVLKKDLATINGYAVLEVVSGSMEPTIHVGDLIVIDTKDKDYKREDIVTFYDVNGSFVTHRIMDIDGDEIITQGDANDSRDDAINKKDIVGVYEFKIPGVGVIMNSFKSPFIMIMILIIGILVCFLVSTDKEGKAILTEDELEFLEFKEYKKNNKKEEVVEAVKKNTPKKITDTKKISSKKTTSKKSTGTKKGTSKTTTTKKISKK